MIDSSTPSSSGSSLDILSHSNLINSSVNPNYPYSNDNLLNSASSSSSSSSSTSSSNSNRWNDHYAAAAYYGSADNYYRNLQYPQANFHPPAYWLHAAAAASEPSANNSWNGINNSNQTSSYYQSIIPSLNTTNLTAPSSSSSSSSSTVSSAANTPQSQSNILNSSDSPYLNGSAANNFNMHTQLVNAYQSYTNNFGNSLFLLRKINLAYRLII